MTKSKGVGRGWQRNGPGWAVPPTGPASVGQGGTASEARDRKAAIPGPVSAARGQRRAEHRDTMLHVYEAIAFDASQPANARVTAVDKWVDRTEGKPVQATVSHCGSTKTLAELVQKGMLPDDEAT